MNPWLRLLLLFGVVVVSALLLKLLPPLLVLVLFVAGATVVTYVLRPGRTAKSGDVATSALGLERVPADGFGLIGLPFALLGRGTGAIVRDAMRGAWSGIDVKVFDITLTEMGEGGSPVQRAFTCALADSGLAAPHLVVEPRAFLTPESDRPDLPEISLEPELLRQGFDVRCRDEPFARSFLDADRTGWLLAEQERWGFEIDGGLVLLYGEWVPAADRAEILEALAGLLERLSRRPDEAPVTPPDRPDDPAG
jgi:hypothetical protein